MCWPRRSAGETSVCLASTGGTHQLAGGREQPLPAVAELQRRKGQKTFALSRVCLRQPRCWKEQSTGELQRACREQWVRFLAQIQHPWGSRCRDLRASHQWVRRCRLPSSGAFGRMLKLPNNVKGESSQTQKGVQAPRCLPRGRLCCLEHHLSMPPSHLRFVTVPCLCSQKDVL